MSRSQHNYQREIPTTDKIAWILLRLDGRATYCWQSLMASSGLAHCTWCHCCHCNHCSFCFSHQKPYVCFLTGTSLMWSSLSVGSAPRPEAMCPHLNPQPQAVQTCVNTLEHKVKQSNLKQLTHSLSHC